MSSVLHLREFIEGRLTAAAEQIFSEFEKTIVRYEEEISRLRLLDIRPGIKSHSTGLDEQQVCDQEGSSSLNQQDPEPPQTKEEQEETCSSEEGEQFELKQEAEGIHVWSREELTTTDEVLDNQQVCDQKRSSSLDQQDPESPQTKDEQEEISLNQESDQLSLKPKTKDVIVWTGQELDIMWNPEVKLQRIDGLIPVQDESNNGGVICKLNQLDKLVAGEVDIGGDSVVNSSQPLEVALNVSQSVDSKPCVSPPQPRYSSFFSPHNRFGELQPLYACIRMIMKVRKSECSTRHRVIGFANRAVTVI
ncbi:uncharacterized protein LOC102199267 [Pundamilia nyererei]|uniref:Uncharacterized protein LOC102199267 n=1 Tax=Pundamilia nyererei TaxID=303518 RepID=A0A9Y3S654_9CICH|nr:PREDICTED: uncharacterized protein LOC102199267 [Pundamilia nyererei]